MANMKTLSRLIATVLLGSLASSSCMGPKGNTVQEKQAYALQMRDEALEALYKNDPEIRQEVEASVGYGVFKNFSIHPGFLSFAAGYGVVTNKATGKDTHMKWARLTLGPGIAVKGLYAVVVFNDAELLAKFEKVKWSPFGQIEATFKFGDFGGGAEHAWTFTDKAKAHYFTHTGVALELEVIGFGRSAPNAELNPPATPDP